MRRRTTSAMPASEPIANAEAIASEAPAPRPPELADGSNLDAGPPAAAPTGELDAILLVYLHDGETGEAPTTTRVELTLYVVDESESCGEALRQLDEILGGYVEGDVRLTVRNLSQVPLEPIETPMLAVPTLIVRGRRDLPMTGDLAESTLLDVLAACGARRVAGR